MNLRKTINDFVECNTFELKLKENKIYIYYYDEIKNFSSNEIIVNDKKRYYKIKGDKLVIETFFEDFIVISGNIKTILMGNINE